MKKFIGWNQFVAPNEVEPLCDDLPWAISK